MAVFEKKNKVEIITGKNLYDYLNSISYDFYTYFGLCDKEFDLIDYDSVLKEFAEYILNKESEV